MSNATFRVYAEHLGDVKDSEFIGRNGDLFYDPKTGVIRLSDGSTPGGHYVTETSALESYFIGDWVYFARPDNQPEVVDEIAPNLIIKRWPGQDGNWGNGSIYNADEDSDGSVSTPYGTQWNTDGWQDLSDVKDRYYQDFTPSLSGGGWASVKHEWIMHDTQNDKYYAIRFLTWDSGYNGETGAFSYIRREINKDLFFVREDTNDEETALVTGDEVDTDLTITRSNGGAFINYALGEDEWSDSQSPLNTLWNAEGWDDLTNLKSRQFVLLADLFVPNNSNLGQHICGKQLIMWDTTNDKYYAIQVTRWQNGNNWNYPGFSYTRRLIDTEKLSCGVRFPDGTIQNTAYSDKVAGVLKQAPKATSTVYDTRYITEEDIGKTIYLYSGTSIQYLRIPDGGAVQWPVGATITIINRTGGNVYLYKDNDDENGTIYGAGTSDNNTAWTIPDSGGGNICTLMKIETGMDNYFNDWMLAGANIVSGD